jgi:hypothetical protein
MGEIAHLYARNSCSTTSLANERILTSLTLAKSRCDTS